jgi:hypothetical protein
VQIARYHLGEQVVLYRTKSGGLSYYYGNRLWQLGDPKRELRGDDVERASTSEQRGPFERADFGDRDRLAWATGACAMHQEVTYVAWGERYAMWLENSWICAVDATRPLVARFSLPMSLHPVKAVVFDGGDAYLQSVRDVLRLPTAGIAGLFERTSGPLAVHISEHYPHRQAAAKAKMVVQYVHRSDATVVDRDGDGAWFTIPLVPGLVRGDWVVLHDRLMKNAYREIEVPGRERVATCELVVEPARDPAGSLAKASTAARTEELARVFGMLADDPDDEATRLVIVDLLEDAGEPYAADFAKLLAGDETVRRKALGTLASYLHVEWRDKLPWSGELSTTAPNDDDIGDLVAADHRLGFFHTLRLGEGNFRVYSKLVASPRAVGLRHVDASRVAILQALIAGQRRELRRLSNVKFATREVLDALADPTFDGVVELETETQAQVVDRLLEFITRDELKFFARTPRHLVLRERVGDDDALVQPVLAAWGRLPLDKLTIAGVTLSRDGTAIAEGGVSDFIRHHVATRFRFVELG